MNRPLTQNEIVLANISNLQRNILIALSAIVASLPKESINREAVRKNIETSQLFGAIVEKEHAVKAEVEKLVDQILARG